MLGTQSHRKEESMMSITDTIILGSDDFIMYIRKHYPTCQIPNDQLARRVWQWVCEYDPAAGRAGSIACVWGAGMPNGLPKTASQVEFRRNLLPALYTELDRIGREE